MKREIKKMAASDLPWKELRLESGDMQETDRRGTGETERQVDRGRQCLAKENTETYPIQHSWIRGGG